MGFAVSINSLFLFLSIKVFFTFQSKKDTNPQFYSNSVQEPTHMSLRSLFTQTRRYLGNDAVPISFLLSIVISILSTDSMEEPSFPSLTRILECG